MDYEQLLPGPGPQLGTDVFAKRRARVAEDLQDDQVLVVATHREALHSRDVHHRFRPHSDFWYLTGFNEPGAALVLEGDTGHSTLFLRQRKPAAEIWTGRRLGIENAPDVLGVDAAMDHDDLAKRLPRLVGDREALGVVGHDPETAHLLPDAETAGDLIARRRMIKDAAEVEMMRAAARMGNEAMLAALPAAKAGAYEFQVDAALRYVYHGAGSTGPSYPPIVGAGANAAVLHYIDNQARIGDGDLVLVDAGCEWGYYASDITRTVPASGRFNDMQRTLYDIVHAAQKAAIAKVRPGNTFRDPHDTAVRVLTEGLVEAGILRGDVDALIDDDAYRSYYMHGTSHFLGLDVHDVGSPKDEDGGPRRLEPGMVLTVEPGLYFNPDFAELPDGIAPLGIRLENDIVVTEDGHEDLQADLTCDADDWADMLRG